MNESIRAFLATVTFLIAIANTVIAIVDAGSVRRIHTILNVVAALTASIATIIIIFS